MTRSTRSPASLTAGLAASSLALIFFVSMMAAPRSKAQTGTPDTGFFQSQVFPVFEAAKCAGCHAPSGVASATRLHFPEKDATPAQIQAFGLSLSSLVDRGDVSKSLLLTKPTNVVRHTGGVRIKPGSPEEHIVAKWVTSVATASDATLAAAMKSLAAGEGENAPKQLVRRLTHAQYDNTVRDLLGDYSKPAERFPPEDYVDGFKNQLTAQGMPPLLVETYSTAAERLALNAFRIGDINGLVPCAPSQGYGASRQSSAGSSRATADKWAFNDQKCRDAFVRGFGLRAFRRPLTDDEAKRYSAVFSEQARVSRRFLDGARVVVEAMLQSPNFLFHVEAGPDGRYADYDGASRLSYLLWNTMPDAALFEAAAKGELSTVAGRERMARRMLENAPKGREALDQFFEEWLRFDRVVNAVKSNRFQPFTPELALAMAEETRALLHHLVWNDRNFMEALTADYSFLTSELAEVYGLPAPKEQFDMVKFPPDSHRAGILGQGTFLASTAGPTDTSPTARGIFIRERLLCQHVPPPPPGVITTLPDPLVNEKPKGRRQLMVEHVENPTCASCHRLMDPIGFGFEHFDAIGQYREKELIPVSGGRGGGGGGRGGPPPIPLDITAQGEIAGLPNSNFTGAKQLGAILADSPVCQECIVRQMFRYSYGRLETASDEKTIDQLYGQFKASGFKLKSLLVALVESPEFLRQWSSPKK
jgi:Protein of unknown function (DUF1592)/Protein of unknown function (DUF1588)/Protein of unknown function (DUF1587)/Protein of unknown function (DUF1595)/Protein of unknown function (DUF1585)